MLPRLTIPWLRTLVWVLCLALPLQAAAVSGMGGCGQRSANWAGLVALQDQAAYAGGHAMAHAETASAAAPVDDGHDMHDATDLNHSQCSACAACFVGAALPSASMAMAAAPGHAVQYSGSEWASLSCSPSRLERPPRTTAA